jgi:hypothetical protein
MTRNIFNIPKLKNFKGLRNLFDVYNYSNVVVKPTKYEQILTSSQITSLQSIYSQYTILLANKSYELIPSNYTQYLTLLNQIKSINVTDYRLQMLIYIAENALLGSINANTLYQRYAYDEIKVGLLNKRIQEILSGKNLVETVSSTTGQFTATKTFKLSPIFSYYVYVYGMPSFGVGFDHNKLNFLKSLPIFNDENKPDYDTIAWPYIDSGAPVIKPALDICGNPIVN